MAILFPAAWLAWEAGKGCGVEAGPACPPFPVQLVPSPHGLRPQDPRTASPRAHPSLTAPAGPGAGPCPAAASVWSSRRGAAVRLCTGRPGFLPADCGRSGPLLFRPQPLGSLVELTQKEAVLVNSESSELPFPSLGDTCSCAKRLKALAAGQCPWDPGCAAWLNSNLIAMLCGIVTYSVERRTQSRPS